MEAKIKTIFGRHHELKKDEKCPKRNRSREPGLRPKALVGGNKREGITPSGFIIITILMIIKY